MNDDDNRLEGSRLDAERIDRLKRQLHSKHMFMQKIMLDSAAALDVMESRAEAAESVVELARRWLHCADTINETFGRHGPIKDYRLFSRQNAEYMAAMEAMCAAIRQTKGTT